MNVTEFKTMVERVRQLEKAMGSTKKFVVEEEHETVLVQRRGLYASKDIPQGKIIEYSDLVELRPALGILPKYKNNIIEYLNINKIKYAKYIDESETCSQRKKKFFMSMYNLTFYLEYEKLYDLVMKINIC
jgi:sialic acid synthase SpsE